MQTALDEYSEYASDDKEVWAQSACEGPWCAALVGFCKKFDTNDPWKMQTALDEYSEYASDDKGIKIAVTKDHFYEMYHGNVGRKLSEYLPQQLFAWSFGDEFRVMKQNKTEGVVKVV